MNEIVMCAAEFLVGVIFLINPVGFTSAIFMGIGIALIAAGIVSVVNYFRTSPETAALEQSLAKGLGEILAGCFCLFRYQWFIVTFPILTVLYGIAIMVTGIVKLQWTVDLIRIGKEDWIISMIGAAITLICAAVIVMNPFRSTAFLWIFAGASLIVEAIFDVILLVLRRKNRSMK